MTQRPINGLVGKVLNELKRDYLVIGKNRVRGWHAWLILGVAVGMAAGIITVANRTGQFERSQAAFVPEAGRFYLTHAEIDEMKRNIATYGWAATAWTNTKAAADAALGTSPQPPNPNQDFSANDLWRTALYGAGTTDGSRAYNLALAYVISGNTTYGDKAKQFLLAWARTYNPPASSVGHYIAESVPMPKLFWAYDLAQDRFTVSEQTEFKNWARYFIGRGKSRADSMRDGPYSTEYVTIGSETSNWQNFGNNANGARALAATAAGVVGGADLTSFLEWNWQHTTPGGKNFGWLADLEGTMAISGEIFEGRARNDFGYGSWNAIMLGIVADVAKHAGYSQDLWTVKTSSGKSVLLPWMFYGPYFNFTTAWPTSDANYANRYSKSAEKRAAAEIAYKNSFGGSYNAMLQSVVNYGGNSQRGQNNDGHYYNFGALVGEILNSSGGVSPPPPPPPPPPSSGYQSVEDDVGFPKLALFRPGSATSPSILANVDLAVMDGTSDGLGNLDGAKSINPKLIGMIQPYAVACESGVMAATYGYSKFCQPTVTNLPGVTSPLRAISSYDKLKNLDGSIHYFVGTGSVDVANWQQSDTALLTARLRAHTYLQNASGHPGVMGIWGDNDFWSDQGYAFTGTQFNATTWDNGFIEHHRELARLLPGKIIGGNDLASMTEHLSLYRGTVADGWKLLNGLGQGSMKEHFQGPLSSASGLDSEIIGIRRFMNLKKEDGFHRYVMINPDGVTPTSVTARLSLAASAISGGYLWGYSGASGAFGTAIGWDVPEANQYGRNWLGLSLEEPVQHASGLWSRRFQHGTVILNVSGSSQTVYGKTVSNGNALFVKEENPGTITQPPISPPPPPPATSPSIVTMNTSVAPTIDGNLSEYASASALTIGGLSGTSGTYKFLWDSNALYVGASVTDSQLNSTITTRDGMLWGEDGVELYFDTLNNRGVSQGPDDYKLFVNLLNTTRDERALDPTYNSSYTSAVQLTGTNNNNSDIDTGYTIEIQIPWSSLGASAPSSTSTFGFDVSLNDLDASGVTQALWSNINGGSPNDPDGWGIMTFGAGTVTPPPPPPPPADYIVNGLASSPGNTTAGQLVSFSATVSNQGSGAASVASATRLRIDVDNNGTYDVIPATMATGALAAGATEVETWANIWTATAGTHRFEICADSASAITEASETNNCATQTFVVSAPAPSPPIGFNAKVNFQPSGTAIPSGYLPDYGTVYGSRGNGYTYGWNADNSANTRDRDSSTSADQRYDTLNHMQKNGTFTWEIAVPSGTYTVRIVAGDAVNYDSVYKTNVEGLLAINASPTSTSPRWYENTITVTVSDGRLTVNNATGASNNKINFIDINSTTVTPPPPPPPPADYIVNGLASSPGNTTAGQLVSFSATVSNQGSGAASVASATRLRIDVDNNGTYDVIPATMATGALAAGATEVETWANIWTATAGTHRFEICADSASAITEASETNNCATQTFVVSAPANLAPNASFESDPNTDYLTLKDSSSGSTQFAWASDAAHTGSRSVKIVSTQSSRYSRWMSQTGKITVQPGKKYTISLWLKTNGATTGARLSANFWNSSKTYLGTTYDSALVTGTKDWTLQTLTLTAPSTAASVRVEFRLVGPGTAWADDVSVVAQ